MGNCESLCQESKTTCAPARTHGGGRRRGGCTEETNCSPEGTNCPSQQPESPSPRHGTFGTFGLEDRSPRAHLLSVPWEPACVEKTFAHCCDQPLPTFFPASSTRHLHCALRLCVPEHRMLIQEPDTVMTEWDAISRQERTLLTGTFSPAFRGCTIRAC